MDYNYRLGIAVFCVNIAIIISCCVGVYLRFNSSLEAKTKREADFHFSLLLAMIAFLIANIIAFYTGYKAYIISPSTVRSDLILYRLGDRTSMLFVSVILLFVGRVIKGIFKEE